MYLQRIICFNYIYITMISELLGAGQTSVSVFTVKSLVAVQLLVNIIGSDMINHSKQINRLSQ